MAASTAELSLDGLTQEVRQRRQELDRMSGAAAELARQGLLAEQRVTDLTRQVELHELATELLTSVGEERQESARRLVEDMASRAMQVIFGEELSFHLVPGERGGQATLEFMVRSTFGDTEVDTSVLDARGGGMAAVLGFVMRFVILMLTENLRKILVLDEPFAHVSAGYEARVAEFLHEVTTQTGVQIVLVTHSAAYAEFADARYRLEQGKSGVTRVFAGEVEPL